MRIPYKITFELFPPLQMCCENVNSITVPLDYSYLTLGGKIIVDHLGDYLITTSISKK